MVDISDITKSLRLLVVDVQDSFLDILPNGSELLKRIDFAIQASQLFQIAITLTEQLPDKLGASNATLLEKIDKESVFTKSTFSALRADGMDTLIKKSGTKHLLVAGLETPICIYQTVLDAMSQDYEVTILSDCVGARRESDAQEIFATLRNTGCHILPSEAVFYSLLGDSQHALFKPYSKLVKRHG